MESRKIKVAELFKNRTQEQVTQILKSEGDSASNNPQFEDWWDIFELERQCNKSGLSELEKWCVLRGRFELKRISTSEA